MSDEHLNPYDASDNPYAAPQIITAEEVLPADPAAMRPGELPCHACGQPVPPKSEKCPRCGVRPLYDSLQLIITAVLVMTVTIGTFLWQVVQKMPEGPFLLIYLGLAIAVIWPTVNFLFTKLKRGKW